MHFFQSRLHFGEGLNDALRRRPAAIQPILQVTHNLWHMTNIAMVRLLVGLHHITQQAGVALCVPAATSVAWAMLSCGCN